jgi:thioredoxin-dependent peroxiredoxin
MRVFMVLVLGGFLFSLILRGDPLPVGSSAPNVTAVDQNGRTVRFPDIYAKGTTLVYFYPKAGTSGCTAEACSLRDAYIDLQVKGLQIIGVSRDTVAAQNKFQQENHLQFTLIADPDGKVAEAFGVPKMGGILPLDARQSFLVKDDKIVWNSPHAATKGAAKEVQNALAGLK